MSDAVPCTVNLMPPKVPTSARLSPMTLTEVMFALGVVSLPPPPQAASNSAATADRASDLKYFMRSLSLKPEIRTIVRFFGIHYRVTMTGYPAVETRLGSADRLSRRGQSERVVLCSRQGERAELSV